MGSSNAPGGGGGGSEQQFCLRWNNFQHSLLTSLPQLLDAEDLTDVTLCAGGRSLKAHRVVLSACSHYFKELFRELQPYHHPVIVLPQTSYGDVCALVSFMYSGEVNIYQEQLPSLLAAAAALHIRGLAEVPNSAAAPQSGVPSLKHSPPVTPPGVGVGVGGEVPLAHLPSSPSASSSHSGPPSAAKRPRMMATSTPAAQLMGNTRTCSSASSGGGGELHDLKVTPPMQSELSTPASRLEAAVQRLAMQPKLEPKLEPPLTPRTPCSSSEERVSPPEQRQQQAHHHHNSASDSSPQDISDPLPLALHATNDSTNYGHSTSDDSHGSEPDIPEKLLHLNPSSLASFLPSSPLFSSPFHSLAAASAAAAVAVGRTKLFATCHICGKSLSNQYNLRVHLETHQNLNYSCSLCTHVSRSRDALRKHIAYKHTEPGGGNGASGGKYGGGRKASSANSSPEEKMQVVGVNLTEKESIKFNNNSQHASV